MKNEIHPDTLLKLLQRSGAREVWTPAQRREVAALAALLAFSLAFFAAALHSWIYGV